MNRLSIVLLSALALLTQPSAASAQDAFGNSGDPKIALPGLTEYAPADPDSAAAAVRRTVRMEAALTENGEPLRHGLTWRIFHPTPGTDGKLPLLASSEGGSAEFEFEPGDYFLHVAFGRAGVTKKLTVPRDGPIEKQHIVMEAGGLILNAVSGIDARIPSTQLRFNIYKAEEGIDGEQQLVVEDVKPNTIVRLNAGTYHIVSEYGSVNAVIRSDIRVEAGKLTEAVIQHRAAQLTLKLVAEPGGEAIADTAWSILTSGGDVVSESVGAFPTIVLAEGEYTAIARNKAKVHQRDFTVVAGRNSDVEVLLN
ncbi:hypothetical protein [Hoeflea sp. EC-HK425]|nr:hypothetical protein [Hoeflea sp. EC-HK425]VVT12766.1 conserved exported hypothetical protein [Hoeflea sp. EC-HK425]|tara:strand:- start:540 stop:1469 length:930 start_codon:yes stop_codon:yes gene_type:complete